jgi:hypothetical protein
MTIVLTKTWRHYIIGVFVGRRVAIYAFEMILPEEQQQLTTYIEKF